MSVFVSPADESSEEEETRDDKGGAWAWGGQVMDGGWGSQHCQRRRHRGCYVRYSSLFFFLTLLSLVTHVFHRSAFESGLYDRPHLFCRDLDCWGKQMHQGRRCRGWSLRDCRKLNWQWQDQMQRVCMGSWGELYPIPPMSSIPPLPKKCCHVPTATVSKPPPQEPEEAVPKAFIPVALEAPSSAGSQTLEVAIPTHLAPLHLQLRASHRSINARLSGAVRGCQPHRLLSPHMCTETT